MGASQGKDDTSTGGLPDALDSAEVDSNTMKQKRNIQGKLENTLALDAVTRSDAAEPEAGPAEKVVTASFHGTSTGSIIRTMNLFQRPKPSGTLHTMRNINQKQ
ncbi:hypothetical protein Bpfe_004398 [Biomphalaria pfeifferi]|uniref:Uncharacterized protein n=1 Tax=Biomphalaria pfeifferi TaxID=112525 RepID=A0AAD8C5F5_BIOPF|nr:hypothetical protein Bpfe_004398 [Biomphalaria pfeifferi]